MPQRKTRTVQTQTSNWATTDTQLIIVVVLLVLAYPFGVIFMWFWMRHWPLWVKLLLSLPMLFLILMFFAVIAFIIFAVTHHTAANFQQRYRPYRYQYQMPPTMRRGEFPSITPTLTPTNTPAPSQGQTQTY
ncbi:MAG TPA: hypothetical protein VLF68_04745 [Candidatus Saccharimonadales bacterium]|nr:hypothetical protein [Candidatus Saccharimonadales bacterium]